MPIMPPDTPLWHEVVAEAGEEAVWPMDSEETAHQLREVWSRLADEVGEGGFQVSQAAGVVASSWPDPAGAAAVDAVTAYFDRIKEDSLQMAWTSIHGLSYEDTIVRTKQAVKETIQGWEEAYAAAGVPRAGKDTAYEQSLVVYHAAQKCFLIMDNAIREVQQTLLRKRAEEDLKERKGRVDALRQIGNLLHLPGLLNRFENNTVLAAATAQKTRMDIEAGKPAGQAIVSNTVGAVVNALVGPITPGPRPLGMLAGMTAGAFTSGATDSLYDNEPTHHATAMVRGGERVVDTYEGIGEAIADLAEGVKDLFTGGGKP